jgi:phosphoglycerol transferase
MPAEFFISLFLLIGSMLALYLSGKSKRRSLISFAAAAAVVSMLIAYAAADFFTGEGINAAVLFHIRYGLHGAGFAEYAALIGVCVVVFVTAVAILAFGCFSRAQMPRRRGYLAASGLMIAGSFVINPATWDLVENARPVAPATADFLRHYHVPRISPVALEHPNFVFIFAESLERTYFDEAIFPGLIRDLRLLEKEGTTFTNINTVEGTGFTMGGVVAGLCGIPLFSPAHANSMSGMDSFLPGVAGLSDLLHEQDYHLAFMGGASLDFAGKGKFLRTHRFDEMSGFSELHARVSDKAYINNWGIYDDTLFEMAFDRFRELSENGKRFGLFLLTLDTHHPNGHVSRSAGIKRYGDGANPMLNAVAASDELIAAFVRRIQSSPFGANTVIVIASDHLAMNNAASEILNRGERRNLFLVLDPRKRDAVQIDRLGSTLDLGPTLLPFLGFKGTIGLGRDLLDPATSDVEIAHIQNRDTLLSWRDELMKFWEFPKFKESLGFSETPAEILMDGRRFSTPALIELKSNHQTVLRFEFDAVWDVRLIQQVDKLSRGTPYILVARREDVEASIAIDAASGADSWMMIIGRAGEDRITRPLTDGVAFTRAEIDALLAETEAIRPKAD